MEDVAELVEDGFVHPEILLALFVWAVEDLVYELVGVWNWRFFVTTGGNCFFFAVDHGDEEEEDEYL